MSDPEGPRGTPGPQEGRCGAIRGRGDDGQPNRWCRKYPRHGQTRCEDHGGNAPQALAAATRRQQEAAAEAAVRTFGLRRDVTAEDALLEELQWTAGHVAWLRDRVAELEPDALVWGRTSEVAKEATEFPGVDTTREAAPNVWLSLYQRERAHLLAVGAAIVKAGVEERRVRIAEAQGAKVVEVIRRSFDVMLGRLVALGLAEQLQGAWPGLMREVVLVELRELAAVS